MRLPLFITTLLWLQIVAVAEPGLLGVAEQYVCYRSFGAIEVDGKAGEKEWAAADWTNDFVDIEGGKKPKPLHRTRVKMLWDDSYFYFLAEMVEPHLWATYMQRDSVIFHENNFEIFIDPDADTHAYYELEINALSTVWDLMLLRPYRDGGGAIDSWDIDGLKKGVHLSGSLNDPSDVDKGWTVELALPWKVLEEANSLTGRPKSGDQWRVNFSRVQWLLDVKDGKYTKRLNPQGTKSLPEFNWVWSPQGVIAMHQPESWGKVQFSSLVAGQGEEIFVERHEDVLRDVLRRVYYAQAAHKKEQGGYDQNLARVLENAGLGETWRKQWLDKLSLTLTHDGYSAQCVDKGVKMRIDAEGRVLKLKK